MVEGPLNNLKQSMVQFQKPKKVRYSVTTGNKLFSFILRVLNFVSEEREDFDVLFLLLKAFLDYECGFVSLLFLC